MKIAKPKASLEKFNDGLKKALGDDGKIGKNDAPALRKLARESGLPQLAGLVDRLEQNYVPPVRHEHNSGSGFAAQVVSFKPGPGGGFNSDHLDVVLGRPEGAGPSQGSLHVVSLGHGGQMTLKLGRPVTNGLKVFENGFAKANGAASDPEHAKVEVSGDGQHWHALKGEAGVNTVQANSQNQLDPRTRAAGGDAFNFKASGVPVGLGVQFVRITDLGQSAGPAAGATAGFDLDAVFGF